MLVELLKINKPMSNTNIEQLKYHVNTNNLSIHQVPINTIMLNNYFNYVSATIFIMYVKEFLLLCYMFFL